MTQKELSQPRSKAEWHLEGKTGKAQVDSHIVLISPKMLW